MTEYVWGELRQRVIAETHDAPNAAQEENMIEVFREYPALVAQSIDRVLAAYAQGTVRSVWAVLPGHIGELIDRQQRAESVTASTSAERQRLVARARQWMHSAGMHFDSESEIEDELRRGITTSASAITDPRDIAELLTLWRELRPIGEQIEDEAIERAERWKLAQRLMREHEVAEERSVLDMLNESMPPGDGNPFLTAEETRA